MNKLTRKFKIVGMPSAREFEGMVFGRQIEYFKKIKEFQENSKSVYISQKRISSAKVISEAKKLYEAKEFYCQFHDCAYYRDDSFQFWYR